MLHKMIFATTLLVGSALAGPASVDNADYGGPPWQPWKPWSSTTAKTSSLVSSRTTTRSNSSTTSTTRSTSATFFTTPSSSRSSTSKTSSLSTTPSITNASSTTSSSSLSSSIVSTSSLSSTTSSATTSSTTNSPTTITISSTTSLTVSSSTSTTVSSSIVTSSTTTSSSSCASPTTVVNQTTCNGQNYVYSELAGYGFIPSDARDKTGDTLGGIGSSAALDPNSWSRNGDVYTGIIWALPDRGWNTNGTLNYQNRVHKIRVTLQLNCSATVADPSPPNLGLTYLDTVLFSDPNNTPTSGLDANADPPYLSFPGISASIPSTTYTGNGYGGDGPGGNRISVDSEGLVLNKDGTFWVSDEYGPYIYNFAANGVLQSAIRPPDAIIPRRNDTDSFSANSPPLYNPGATVTPANPTTGRANNQGFEGLTASPDGTKLYTLLQSALNQEGGTSNSGRRYARMLVYDTTTPSSPVYQAEYVVPLPQYVNNAGNNRIAAQSEIHYISDTQFLILARDSGSGRGATYTNSIYRHADVFDISSATNIKGSTYDSYTGAIASTSGVLKADITPATYCPWLDFNVNSQLNRFGLHNGGAQDASLLNEKWESFALAPVNPGDPTSQDFFLFSLSDNDFITQNGYLNSGQFRYADQSGYDIDNQVLVFRVTLPTARPLTG